MEVNVGFVAFFPSSTTGLVSTPGTSSVNTGDIIQSVFDLATGADVTSSFDPMCEFSTIKQLDNTPNTSHCHLAMLQKYGTTPHNFVMTVATSLGSNSSANGAVTANGVNVGDIITQAIYPTANLAISVQFPDSWASTIKTANTLTQIAGAPNTEPTLFILQRGSFSDNPEMILTIDEGFPGSGSVFQAAPILPGSFISQVLDISAGVDVTSSIWQFAGGQIGGTSWLKNTSSANDDLFLIVGFPSK